jgi:hypothetical protein
MQAVLCPGVPDIGAAVNTALTSGARHVRLEPGTYYQTSPIDVGRAAWHDDFTLSIDAECATLIATAPMSTMVYLRGRPDGQELGGLFRFGELNGAHLVTDATVIVVALNDSRLEVRSLLYSLGDGLILVQRGDFGVFNNYILIDAIRHNQHNGILINGPDDGDLGVQGNRIEVGQIFRNGHSGIAIFGRTTAWNHFVVGPVEHNGYFGLYDNGYRNAWHIVNTNSNGFPGYSNPPASSQVYGFIE